MLSSVQSVLRTTAPATPGDAAVPLFRVDAPLVALEPAEDYQDTSHVLLSIVDVLPHHTPATVRSSLTP